MFVIVLVTKFAAGRLDRGARGADPVRGDEGASRATTGELGAQLAPAAAGVALPAASTPWCWSPTCWRRRCARWPSPRRRNPATLRAVKVAAEDADDPLPQEWERARRAGAAGGDRVALTARRSGPVLRYVRQLRREHPGDVISVVIPEYVVEHWWQHLLHNQTALRLKGRLLFEPSVTVTSVPWVLPVSPPRITYVRSEDLLDDPVPSRVARSSASAAAASSAGLGLARWSRCRCSPCCSTRSTISSRSTARSCSTCSPSWWSRSWAACRRGGRLRGRRRAADQLLLRRAASTR